MADSEVVLNPNLVPTPVTDKNGVVTTRWKRPALPSTSTGSLPAPAVPLSQDQAPTGAAVAPDEEPFDMRVALSGMLYTKKAADSVVQMFEEKLHPDTLDILDQKFNGNYVRILPLVERCILQQSVASLNNAAVFVDMLEECGPNEVTQGFKYQKCIFGLQWKHPVNQIDFSLADEKGKVVGRALMSAAIQLGRPYVELYVNGSASMDYIPSPHLIELISRRPEDVDSIIELLRSRRLHVFSRGDIAMIEGMLNESIKSSLGNGVL